MAGPRKTLERVLDGRRDAAIPFEDLRSLLLWLGFVESVKGSHHLFRHGGGLARINLQRDGRHAKVYQVRQVRAVLASQRTHPDGRSKDDEARPKPPGWRRNEEL